jgi:transposase
MAMTIVESTRPVTGGVGTHADVHVAAAVDGNGGLLRVESFATTPAGYVQLHGWLAGFGAVARVGRSHQPSTPSHAGQVRSGRC